MVGGTEYANLKKKKVKCSYLLTVYFDPYGISNVGVKLIYPIEMQLYVSRTWCECSNLVMMLYFGSKQSRNGSCIAMQLAANHEILGVSFVGPVLLLVAFWQTLLSCTVVTENLHACKMVAHHCSLWMSACVQYQLALHCGDSLFAEHLLSHFANNSLTILRPPILRDLTCNAQSSAVQC
jgi:hypothetical protein